MNTQYYTVKEVADILKVNVQTVYRWEREGRMFFIRPTHGIVRISQKEIDRFMQEQPEQER